MDSFNIQSFELDLKYHLYEDENDDDSISTENAVAKHFTWLNKLISYSPTWATKTISGKSKNKFLTTIMMLSIVVCICVNMFALNIFKIDIIVFYTDDNHHDIVERIIIPMTRTVYYVSRIMGDIIFISIFYRHGDRYRLGALWCILGVGFRDIPLLSLLSVQAAIFIKYAYYLSHLTTLISLDSNSMQDLISQYKMLYKAFKKDQHPILNYAMHVYLLSIVMQSWFIAYELKTHYGELHVIHFLLWMVLYSWFLWTPIIYIVSSILLNETFEKLSTAIWKLSDAERRIENDLLHLIIYTQKYGISDKVGSLIVTKKNVINIIIVLGFAKLISYSMRYFEYH